MIELVFASTVMLADLAVSVLVGLLVWLLAGVAVAIPVCRRLARVSDQYPPAEESGDDRAVQADR